MRHGMWEKVAKRSHKPAQIYAFGAGSDDVMLHGSVDYELKDGKKTSTPWAARANLTKEDGKLVMERYLVFLVSLRILLVEAARSDGLWLGYWCDGASQVDVARLQHLARGLCDLAYL